MKDRAEKHWNLGHVDPVWHLWRMSKTGWASFPHPLIPHRRWMEASSMSLACAPCCCSVTKLCPTLCDPMDCSTPGFPVLHRLAECAQTHVHWFGDAGQPSYPLLPSSPLALNLFQHQGLFQWVSSLHQAAKDLELQLQHQSFQWMLCFLDLYIWSWFSLSDHTLMLKCPEVPISGAFLKPPSLP